MRFLSIFAAAVFVFTGCSESDKTTTTVAPTTETVTASTTITTSTTTSSPAQTLSAAVDTMLEKLAENFDVKTWFAAWSSLSSLAEAYKPEDQREFVANFLVKRQALIKSAWEKVPADIADLYKTAGSLRSQQLQMFLDVLEADPSTIDAKAHTLATMLVDNIEKVPKALRG